MIESFVWKLWPWLNIAIMSLLTQWMMSVLFGHSENSYGSSPDPTLPGKMAFGIMIISILIGAALSILILYALGAWTE